MHSSIPTTPTKPPLLSQVTYTHKSLHNRNRAKPKPTMCSPTLLAILLTIFSLVHTPSVQSATYTPSCVSNIILCGNYVATTAIPPQSCCDPLKIAVTTQIDCLCGLYNTPGLLQSFNINVTQALDVPKRCRIDGVDLASCSKVAGSTPSPSQSTTPTETPGKDINAAGRITGFAISSGLVVTISWLAVLIW